MKLKKAIKQMIGEENAQKGKAWMKYCALFPHYASRSQRFSICSNIINGYYHIKSDRYHVFCGYFDIAPDSVYNPELMLVHMLDKSAIPGRDSVRISCANIKTGKIESITNSNAWSWQMGSRLRWSQEPGVIYFNDYINGEYCCRKYNLESKQDVKTIPHALYDISADEKIGISINFSRLQRLRPGYGYANIPDESCGVVSPRNDGLFVVNLQNSESTLLVTYEQLEKLIPAENRGEAYINHVSISPNGKNAMFFYIWCTDKPPGWKATLCIADLQMGAVRCIESEDQVSHYDWLDDSTLLITGTIQNTRTGFYRYYFLHDETKETIEHPALKQDGHPVFSRESNKFYADTYPDKNYKQSFFQFENNQYTKLATLYHDPRMFKDKRCDLHPHYFQTREAIAIDTTFSGNKRSVVVFNISS